jgi:toxin ParE1/3/4
MGRVIRRTAASDDLVEHFAYIAADSPRAASRFLENAEALFESLLEMPGMGTPLPDINPRFPGLRRISVKGFPNHVVYYSPEGDDIRILRILHAARDRDWVLRRER